MSWETLVVGNFRFKKGISRELKKKIKNELDLAVECKAKYSKKWKEFEIQDVNWVSHVKGENIVEVIKKYKKHFEYVSISIYYLTEADENILLEKGELTADLI